MISKEGQRRRKADKVTKRRKLERTEEKMNKDQCKQNDKQTMGEEG